MTIIAGGTGGGRDRKQVKEILVVTVEQKGRWFFPINDRFIESRIVTLDH